MNRRCYGAVSVMMSTPGALVASDDTASHAPLYLVFQRAALQARLQSVPEAERADFMAAQIMAAQAAVADAEGPRSAMTQSEQLRFFQSLHAADGSAVAKNGM